MAKNNTNTNSVSSFVVFAADGAVDLAASVSKFETALLRHVAEQGELLGQARTAVNAVFDEYVGCVLTTPQLVNAAMRKIEYSLDQFEAVNEAIYNLIKTDPAFEVKRGPGGGVRRICDIK